MTQNTALIRRIVDNNITASPSFPRDRNFGITLFMTREEPTVDSYGAGEVATYHTISEVALDWDTDTDTYKVAASFFGQQPRPATLKIVYLQQGEVPTSPAQQFLDMIEAGVDWYQTILSRDMEGNDPIDLAGAVEADANHFLYLTDPSALPDQDNTSDNGTSLASKVKNGNYVYTACIYESVDNPDALVAGAIAAKFAVVNYAGTDTMITAMFKSFSGQANSQSGLLLTTTQRDNLDSKNCNYYNGLDDDGGTAIFATGITGSGRFIDEVQGLAWLQNDSTTKVFGYLYTQPRVAQTDKGMSKLGHQLTKSLDQAVRNGLGAPGVWQGEPLGDIKTGDFLPKGYYIYLPPVKDQDQGDREARISPLIQYILVGAGAFHKIMIAGTFQR